MNTKEWKMTEQTTITDRILKVVFTRAADTKLTPVDLGFKLNNLTETEFRFYANKLMNMDTKKAKYQSKEDRDKVFFRLYDINNHLIKNKPMTDKEIRLKNNNDWKDLQIAYLLNRLDKAKDCYRELRDFSEECIDQYLEAGQATRKGSRVIVSE